MENGMRVAVWISGGGTTLRNMLDKIEQGLLSVDIALVICSSATAGGVKIAEQAGLDGLVVVRSAFGSTKDYSEEMFEQCRTRKVDYVVMGGFLKHVLIPDDFQNRVVNIHPSLIPAFCGKGMYGSKVHEAVIEYGVKMTGCTVHFVDDEFDHGPIILQRYVNVIPDDDAESIAAKVFQAECEAYPTALQWIAKGLVTVEKRTVSVRQ